MHASEVQSLFYSQIIFLEFLEAIVHFSFVWHLAAIEGKRKEEETQPTDELKEQVEKGHLSCGNRRILIKKDEQGKLTCNNEKLFHTDNN